MSRINAKPPMGQKKAKAPKDPMRLGRVGAMPCIICVEWDMVQNSPTEVHHCKSGRYSFAKASDAMTIPLCHSHHNKLRPYAGDEDKIGFHNNQETWEGLYGPDVEYLAIINERLDVTL